MARPLAIPGRSNSSILELLGWLSELTTDVLDAGARSWASAPTFEIELLPQRPIERGKPAHPPGSAGGKR